MSKNLAIIDADSIAYLGGKEDSLEQILEKVDYKIQEILTETKADYYVLLVSKGKYFRHEISKSKEAPEGSYKANRTYTTQPWVETIKEYLIVKYKAVWYPNLEADDIVTWLINKPIYWAKFTNPHSDSFWMISDKKEGADEFEEINKILVAKDKDLLYSIPGKHLNFSKKLSSGLYGMEWVETSINNAPFFIWEQMVCNDNGDNIKGLYRKGKAWCDKNFAGKSLKEVQHIVFDEYISEYGTEKGIYELQKNYRLLHMLDTDEDMLREVDYIPQLPEFTKVTNSSEEEIKIDF